ncbi:conserved hypothetical protein [Altererythrobacter sp. B11]|uniref:hypothetical protein n=1 Tax=Altererythrobacter sp. B11 TaxID=2060312 RepID=UPI000DC6E986|nr:hypothetical protein [Altererythrobacter sp. B11]BBC72375.1 conserved hypothetical protein [Altererythrobacter sp. B11]
MRFTSARLRAALPLTAAAALALGACSSRDEAEEATPSPTPVLTPAVQPTVAADGTALTPGRWEVGENAEGTRATYGETPEVPTLTFTCDRASKDLALTIADAAAKVGVYRIEAGEMKVGLSMAASGDGGVKASVDRSQPTFASFADPAALITISGPDIQPLRVPGRSAIDRVLTACS